MTAVLILGESGSGKSTSIRNLNPKETCIISALGKPLPFRGWKNLYNQESKNYLVTDDAEIIRRALIKLGTKPEIKTVIIDDFQYIMANEFMRKSSEKGYEKFTEIGRSAWEIIMQATNLPNKNVIVLSHSEESESGKRKAKTIGKMLDDKINVEGMFTIVLHAVATENKYKFITQNNGVYTAKSPMGMFADKEIDNDLKLVCEAIYAYEDDGVPEVKVEKVEKKEEESK